MATCRACPVFWNRLETCGSPMSKTPAWGCWCFMPEKARLKDAECWLDQRLGDDAAPNGWRFNVPDSSTELAKSGRIEGQIR